MPAAPVTRTHRRRSVVGLGLLASLVLLLGTGCQALGLSPTDPADAVVHSVDPNVPFVVVTVGGVPAGTPTPGVATTIAESTPLPRIELPTRDPAAPARPVASPSLSRGGTTAQAARPPSNQAPAGSPGPIANTP